MRNFPKRLLLFNRAWVANRLSLRNNYFKKLSSGQQPQALWLGCCDSRVPAEEITGARPGDLFVHRNIANVVPLYDTGMFSVLYYSLLVLKVKHVIVCGHTGCGGVLAAIQGVDQPDLKQWLEPVRSLVPPGHRHYKSPEEIPEKLSKEIVQRNVELGVRNLSQHPFVKLAGERKTLLNLQGWVYDLQTGLLEPVCECTPENGIELVRGTNDICLLQA